MRLAPPPAHPHGAAPCRTIRPRRSSRPRRSRSSAASPVRSTTRTTRRPRACCTPSAATRSAARCTTVRRRSSPRTAATATRRRRSSTRSPATAASRRAATASSWSRSSIGSATAARRSSTSASSTCAWGEDGRITAIAHVDLPGERERLDAIRRRMGTPTGDSENSCNCAAALEPNMSPARVDIAAWRPNRPPDVDAAARAPRGASFARGFRTAGVAVEEHRLDASALHRSCAAPLRRRAFA